MEPSDVPDATATVLYVGNMDRRVTEAMMLNILKTGLPHISDRVLSAKMFAPTDPMQGPDGYCFVEFTDNNSACQAMTFLNGREFWGKKVKVNWATNSNTNGGMPKIIGTSVTIFVGDLDDEITDQELRQAFDPFGEILNAKVVRDPVTHKSKNYGFISFNNKPDAEKAIRDMHGAMLKRRPIKTNWATRSQKATPSSLEYDQVYNESNEENCTVYVTNLPDRITDEVISEHFKPYGKILGRPKLFEGKNFCFIKFENHSAATNAITKGNGSELHGAVLKCWWGKDNTTDVGSPNNGPSSNFSRTSNPPKAAPSTNYNGNQQMTPEQYQQYMMNYYNNPYYQQYYYQWMQQYQMQMQQQGQAAGNYGGDYNQQQPQQQGGGPPQGNYPPQSYQN